MSSAKLPSRNFQPLSSSPLADSRETPKQLQSTLHPSKTDVSNETGGAEDEIRSDSDDELLRDLNIPATLLDKLKTFPLFRDAPKSFHAKVGSKLKLVQYHAQEYIIKEGDPALSMFWILKGTVGVTSTDGESVYAELKPGSFFGEIGILFKRPRTATVVARGRVLVGVLTADSLNDVLRSYPVMERRIRDEAQERLAMQEKKNRADIPIIKVSKKLSPANWVENRLPPLPAVPRMILPSGLLPLSQLVHNSSSNSKVHLAQADNVDQTVSIQDFITSVPIFSKLPSRIIHRLALGVEPLTFNAYEMIVRKDTKGSDIYFITWGTVEVIDYQDKSEVILAHLKPGSFFGEMSFLEFIQGTADPIRSASIRSVTSVELLVIRTDSLQAVCQQYPNIVAEMRKTANERKTSNQNALTAQSEPPYLIQFQKPDFSKPSEPLSRPVLPSFNSNNQHGDLTGPNSIFNPNWNFGSNDLNLPGSRASSHTISRSVSPVSNTESEILWATKTARTLAFSTEDPMKSRKRKSISDFSLSQMHLPQGPIDFTVPPEHQPNSLRRFLAIPSRRQSFQYIPHNKRIRLMEMAGRRRSSILSSTGSIPDSILLKVFEFLTLPELMKFRGICRRWRQLLYVAPNLFKTLDLTPWNTSVDDQALIRITDFVGSRPKYIDISNCFHVTNEGFSYMVNEIGMSGRIKMLKMRCLWEVSAMAIMDLTSPSVGRYLEEVDLSNCRKVEDVVIERLIGWSNEGSTHLDHPHGSEGISSNETGSRNLRVLNLGYCKHLTDHTMYHLSKHANESLESLDLTRCTTISDAGFQYWSQHSFPNLKKLSLKDCTFLTDQAIISLANAAPNLEILDLNFCCALLDVAIEVLCLGCPKLRELDLSFCGSAVSDSSLVAISIHLFNLERLYVKGCIRVTRAGVDALLSGYCPLTYINISQCRNAHMYPGRIPAQKLEVNPSTKSAYITAGPAQKIIELVI
ncbi:hypothetical protein PUMCH_000335 [Australozyma saopauloensis]|uniref:Uncharacterized protein n=1 Tax=Australozyma saopauloensis TaxID=291208 RepID=A0AAX4H3E9_9ASCO|nr:hypothetical protein PUMCH_000335 [[Candida] saopauloensis]